MYYPVISTSSTCGYRVAVTINTKPSVTNLSKVACTNGWLGSTRNVNSTALGGFSTLAAARKKGRLALREAGFRPDRMETLVDWSGDQSVSYVICGVR